VRLCLVTTFYPPYNFGGDGIHVQRLAEALARRGHDVTVVHSRGAYRALRGDADAGGRESGRAAGVRVFSQAGIAGRLEPFFVHQSGVPVLSRGYLARTLAGPDGSGFDVIHYHNVSLVGGVGVFALGSGVKLFTAHEYWLGCPTHLLFRYNREVCTRRTCVRCTLRARRPPQWWRYTGLARRHLSQLDVMIFPSALTESVYRELGIDRPGIVLPHFLPDRYLRDAAGRGERDAGAPDYCLYVGRLDAVKGLQYVLPSFAGGDAQMPLWIAGAGPQGDELRRRYGDSPNVRFLGHLGGERLGALYRDAAAVILPSAGLETFGQVILEAFAHGTPAITSGTGGGRELVEAGGAGFTYDSKPALLRALEQVADPAVRDRLGGRAKDYIGRAHAESAYLDRYESLIEEQRR
jgi:glycosyltransferase involved in cell wall biosynthesis